MMTINMSTLFTMNPTAVPSGTRSSGTFSFPVTNLSNVELDFTVDAANRADPTFTMTFNLMVDQGAGFQSYAGFTYHGGGPTTDRNGNPILGPKFGFSSGDVAGYPNLVGKSSRLDLTINKNMTLGVTVLGT